MASKDQGMRSKLNVNVLALIFLFLLISVFSETKDFVDDEDTRTDLPTNRSSDPHFKTHILLF